MIRTLDYRTALEWIADFMMQSDQSWHQLAYYRPLNVLVSITSKHLMEVDEPGLVRRLERQSRKMVEEFSRGSDDFIVFPSLRDEERKAVIEEFISQLPSPKKELYAERWKRDSKRILENWRPSAIYMMFESEEDRRNWEDAVCRKLESAIDAFANKHGIDLLSLSCKYLQ